MSPDGIHTKTGLGPQELRGLHDLLPDAAKTLMKRIGFGAAKKWNK
jgi:hypothetical protein